MELRHLRYFVAIAEAGGFTRAAERLHITQPGLSAQIAQLEKELGLPLLHRGGRRVTLTEAGAAVLPHARAALAAAERAGQVADEFTGLLRGQVRIGLISGATADEFDVAGALAGFHAAHPGISIGLTEDISAEMLAAVLRGELDAALVSLTSDPPDPRLGLQIILDTPVVAAVAADAEGYGPTLRVRALRDRPLICLPTGTGVRAELETACAAAGFRAEVAFEAAAPPLLLRLAARGFGIAIVPGLGPEEAEAFGVRAIPLVPEIRGRLALAWNAEQSRGPAATALVTALRSAFAPA
ncbi:LysR family transcriptional regulator [Nocardia sp. NPDC057227]|uniref:LysR family transcriptional regulator n=1 Tax=Nocardia sp. NPDC057227 TaxID=3346056 RepID=UPI00362F536F